MTYSEATQRILDRYSRKLVKNMPRWIRKYFNSGSLFFEIDNFGNLVLACDPKIPKDKHSKIGDVVYKYMDNNPCDAFKVLDVQ